jgi:hypothetical protein
LSWLSGISASWERPVGDVVQACSMPRQRMMQVRRRYIGVSWYVI